MRIKSFLKIFKPNDDSFFPLFEKDVQNMVKATKILAELMSSSEFSVHEKFYKEIKAVEHEGDEITKSIYRQLNNSFITPFDREDIHQLTARIDDVVDSINGISRRIYQYKPKKIMPVYKEMAFLIQDASIEIETAVICLDNIINNRSKINKSCINVSIIEHKADELYFSGISDVFENEADTKELLIVNKILEILERCVDEEEDVTDTLKAILVKTA
jgi:uncharacterized protein